MFTRRFAAGKIELNIKNIAFMKKISFVLLILLSGYLIQAQDGVSGSGQEEGQDANLFSFPVSPEAGRLGTYGNVPVNMSTGQMNFPIPLYTIKERGYSWPISLSYNFKGLVYEGKPSVTGLGWNLQAGGVVTREVRGIPDEHPKGYYGVLGERQRLLNPYFDNGVMTRGIAKELADGNIDGEADKYYVSVNGISFSFKIGLDKTPVYLSKHNYKVKFKWKNQYELNGFEVIDDNGIYYLFDKKEYNSPLGGNYNVFNDSFTQYVSSWNLTQVVFPNNERLDFSYQERDYYSLDFFASGVANSKEVNCNPTGGMPDVQLVNYNDGYSKTKIIRQVLTAINSSTSSIYFGFPLEPGPQDNFRVTYSNIHVRDKYSNTILWDYDLRYEGARDLLKSITRNDTLYYAFDYYHKHLVPNFINNENDNPFKQDIWGFYNGVNNQHGINIPNSPYEADKRPNFKYTSTGALSKITYPTGGYSSITYEQNTVKENYQDILNSDQEFAPNWQIHLKLQSDQTTISNYKEEKFRYTFTEDVVADIQHKITALPASFSGVSMIKIDNCTGATNGAGGYGDYADNLRLSRNVQVPKFCPRVYDVIDDGDIQGGLTDPITKKGNSRGKIKIEAGTYEFKIWTQSNHEPVSGEIKVKFYKPLSNNNDAPLYENKLVGGIRIHQVKHFTDQEQLGSTQLYEYVDEQGYSSGEEIQKAFVKYSYQVKYGCSIFIPFANIYKCEYNFFNRTNYTSKTYNALNVNQGVPVLYKTVRESSGKLSSVSKGIRSDCNTPDCLNMVTRGTGVLSYIGGDQDLSGNAIDYYPKGYKETDFYFKKIGSAIEYPVRPKGIDLDQGRITKIKAFKYSENENSYSELSESDNRYQKLEQSIKPNHPQSVIIGYKIKEEGKCFEISTDYNVFEFYRLETYREVDKRYIVNQTVKKTFFPEIMSTTTDFSYDSRSQVKKTITTDSENNSIETENFYTYDPETNDSGMSSANILTPILGTVSKNNGVKLQQSRIDYHKINERTTSNSAIFKPIKSWFASGDEPLRGVTKYDQYDDYGNLLQYFKITKDDTTSSFPDPTVDEGGAITAAIWGYNHTYPIAQIVNASYDDAISYLSMSMEQLQALDGPQLRTELDRIRQGLPQAQITTYTYKPQVGVTSVTDPRGHTMYYEYDELYRLKKVKDVQGNILSKNEYNYKNN